MTRQKDCCHGRHASFVERAAERKESIHHFGLNIISSRIISGACAHQQFSNCSTIISSSPIMPNLFSVPLVVLNSLRKQKRREKENKKIGRERGKEKRTGRTAWTLLCSMKYVKSSVCEVSSVKFTLTFHLSLSDYEREKEKEKAEGGGEREGGGGGLRRERCCSVQQFVSSTCPVRHPFFFSQCPVLVLLEQRTIILTHTELFVHPSLCLLLCVHPLIEHIVVCCALQFLPNLDSLFFKIVQPKKMTL